MGHLLIRGDGKDDHLLDNRGFIIADKLLKTDIFLIRNTNKIDFANLRASHDNYFELRVDNTFVRMGNNDFPTSIHYRTRAKIAL